MSSEGTGGHIRSWSSWVLALSMAVATHGCSSSDGGPADDAGAGGAAGAGADAGAVVTGGDAAGAAPDHCASIAQLQAWQAEIDQFDSGYRPTGSPAHEAYIELLRNELIGLGVSDVHTEPFVFNKWTPSSWSLSLLGGASSGSIAPSGYIPYSGSTGPSGVTGGLVYLPSFTLPLDPTSLAKELQDPSGWSKAISAQLEAAIAGLAVAGRIAVFQVPKIEVAYTTVTGTQLYLNDPGATIPPNGTLARTDLAMMLYVPVMLNLLATAGAVGAVGILDVPEEAARSEYAPFFGAVSPNMPALYVDRDAGAKLTSAMSAAGPLLLGKLVLDATIAPSTSENLVGVLPGASTEEIILGSHTDGPNSIEDNGPAAILALASCLQKKPLARTVRILLSGGHFSASFGLNTYAASHAADLAAHARAAIEIEHLGALEWAEQSPGVMGLTGRDEVKVLTTWQLPALVAASEAFAAQFPRSVVGAPPLFGEGPNLRGVPLVQFFTMPEYLLVGRLPAITTQFTDYGLMQRQVDAFAEMESALGAATEAALGH
jgi:hypothetical protein